MALGAFGASVFYLLLLGPAVQPQIFWKWVGGIFLFLFIANLGVIWVYRAIVCRITDDVAFLAASARAEDRESTPSFLLSRNDELGVLSQCLHAMTLRLKEASQLLLEERNQLERIIVSIPEGVLVVDNQKKLIVMNPAAERLLKTSAVPCIGENILDQQLPPSLQDAFFRIFDTQKHVVTEAILPRSDHKVRTLYILGTGLLSFQNQHTGWVVILRDITHERELESLRDGFLRTITHELRTPLTSIIGFVELLLKSQMGEISSSQRDALDIVYQESNRLKTLIDDLLELSRMSAGQMSLTYSPVPLYELLNNVSASFQPLASGKDLCLGVTPPVSGEVVLLADAARLRQILVNLVSNAIKFTQTGFVTLYLYDLPDCVEIGVKDSGIGLCDEDKEVVFDKFRQVDFTTTRRFDGIGLGLSIVKQLVELHAGSIRVESVYKEGTCFIVSLPKVQFV